MALHVSGTCAARRVLHGWDALLTRLPAPVLTPRAAVTKASVAPVSGQLLRAVGVTAAPLRGQSMMGKRGGQREEGDERSMAADPDLPDCPGPAAGSCCARPDSGRQAAPETTTCQTAAPT